MSAFFELLPGFVLTFVTAFLILWFVYNPSNPHNQEYVVTFLSFNILLYFIIALLRDVQLSIGFGFGLLAVFSTLSYRSANIPVKEMTYLFICITLPFINTLFAVTRVSFFELILVNALIFVMILALEKVWGVPYQHSKQVLYEKIELIKPQNYKLLIDDLRERTGLDVLHCEVEEIDFLHDTAMLIVYYKKHT